MKYGVRGCMLASMKSGFTVIDWGLDGRKALPRTRLEEPGVFLKRGLEAVLLQLCRLP